MKTISLGDKHILTKANWIWPNGLMYLYNHYAQFRKDFELASSPAKAPFYITADRNYRLYVNGEFVCGGPARGYQSHWPFDEVDLAGYLQPGHNWISVEAYTPGISNFQYLHKNWAGLLCAGKFGRVEIISDDSWIMRRAPGRLTDTARYSLQLDFQEIIDSRLEDRKWIFSAKPPRGWDPTLGHQGQDFKQAAFGRPPWDSVEARGIPLLEYGFEMPLAPEFEASGKSKEDYQTRKNISWGWLEEMKSSRWSPAKVTSSVQNDWRKIKTVPVKKGRFKAYAMNFERNFVGTLLIEISGAQGGEIIDLQHEQFIPDGKPYYRIPGHGCDIATGNRIIARKGKTEHEFYSTLTTGNLTLVVRDASKPLTIKLKLRTCGYPFTMKGKFECGDEVLNTIHSSCKHCQKICSLDAYVDTPWREQAQWWGDARVQAKNTFYLDGDARLLKRGIRSIAGQSTSQGLTYGHAPTVADNCILPDFSLTWIMTTWDYYWQTADISLFKEQWPRIQQVMGYFSQKTSRHSTGLIRHDPRFWYFGDWADLYTGDVPTLLNMYFLQVLEHIGKMLTIAKRNTEAKQYHTLYKKHQALIMKHLFNRKEKLMYAGLDQKGNPCADYSVHDQVMAIILGLAKTAHTSMLEKKLLPYIRGEKISGAVPSAFWVTYLFEVLGTHGYGDEVIQFIRRKWEPMSKTTSTWEDYAPENMTSYAQVSGSMTHAWTAHPSFHLVNILAGVRQSDVNWKKVSIEPILNPAYGPVHTIIPTPHGKLEVKIRYKKSVADISIKLPKGLCADFICNGKHQQIKGSKRLTV